MSPRIMVVGAGDVGTKTAYALAHNGRPRTVLLAGRNAEAVELFVNLTRFSALQRGLAPDVSGATVDLEDIERTASVIEQFRPDVIFAAATVQSWWVLFNLPKPKFERLYQARFGPWLAMHLAPVAALMQAVRMSGTSATVVNASFPDAVNPMLAADGLSPHLGIGNVANNVPALRCVIADDLGVDASRVGVRFVAHHFVSHRLSRAGDTGGARFDLSATVDDEPVTGLDPAAIFKALPVQYRRTGGMTGQAMTVASALSALEPLLDGTAATVHAPGIDGLVGGYPVRIAGGRASLDLPPALTRDEAVAINEHGQRFDGIAQIDEGCAVFEDWAAEILRAELGYHCDRMHWTEAADRARELRAKYVRYAESDSASSVVV
jgi:hypothetical protein